MRRVVAERSHFYRGSESLVCLMEIHSSCTSRRECLAGKLFTWRYEIYILEVNSRVQLSTVLSIAWISNSTIARLSDSRAATPCMSLHDSVVIILSCERISQSHGVTGRKRTAFMVFSRFCLLKCTITSPKLDGNLKVSGTLKAQNCECSYLS